MCILNPGFTPTTAFHLFKQFRKPGVEGYALVCLGQHPAVPFLSSTWGKEKNPLVVACCRSPYIARCALFL